MKSTFTSILALVILLISACEPDHPGIQEIELKLDTLPFDNIMLETDADVRIIQADHYQVIIQGFESEVYDVDVRVVGDQLTIDQPGHFSENLLIKVLVPEISQLQSFGSSYIYGESYFTQDRNMDITLTGSGEIDFAVETGQLDVAITGSGNIYLEGDIEVLDVEIDGSGWVRSFSLSSLFTDVRIEGSGSAEVTVSEDLDAFILGSGDIYYKGHPLISATITGSGELIDAN